MTKATLVFRKPLHAIAARIGATYVLFFLSLIIESCHLSRRVFVVPSSFYDTISTVQNRLDTGQYQYIFYTENTGNCFGGSLSASATVIWFENGKYYRRRLSKESQQRTVRDHRSSGDYTELFQFFAENHIDTIASLPTVGFTIDPPSHGRIVVKQQQIIFTREFDPISFFTTHDTLHPLFLFVNKVVLEK